MAAKMNNAELIEDQKLKQKKIIAILRHCGSHKGCYKCPLAGKSADACMKILLDAADALEAQQKALDECAVQLAELATKLERLKSSNDELRERQTYIDHWGNKWMTSGEDVPTAAYNHGFLDGEKAVSVDLRSVRKGEQE